jgi:hypothetical protein
MAAILAGMAVMQADATAVAVTAEEVETAVVAAEGVVVAAKASDPRHPDIRMEPVSG